MVGWVDKFLFVCGFALCGRSSNTRLDTSPKRLRSVRTLRFEGTSKLRLMRSPTLLSPAPRFRSIRTLRFGVILKLRFLRSPILLLSCYGKYSVTSASTSSTENPATGVLHPTTKASGGVPHPTDKVPGEMPCLMSRLQYECHLPLPRCQEENHARM